MKAVIEIATGKVVFAAQDTDELTLDDKGLSGAIRALDITPETHKIKTVADNPDFVGGVWSHAAMQWEVIDAARLMQIKGEQIALDITNAIQTMLDAKAREFRYDSIHTACGWAGLLDDATALKSWGAACWAKSFEIEQDIIAGKRGLLTVAKIMAEMPKFGE
jgi:hypothetical protein